MTATEPAAQQGTVPALLGHYHHLGITVTDVVASEVWYSEVFGMQRAFVEQHPAGGYAVVLQRPGTGLFLGLDHHDGNPGEPFDERRTGLDHFSFAVGSRAELDDWVAHLDRLGLPHSGIKEPDLPFPCALIVLRDPDGVQIEITWT
ncbi:VOC family protein [Pseudonocardia nigra]|uniref:VOC family protein n=1 Tax=Pseudonocardia nigra TaxID=1921578 RepID=UPI001C5E3C06|nr:VOC family protein [Pseudonocardia nigra]